MASCMSFWDNLQSVCSFLKTPHFAPLFYICLKENSGKTVVDLPFLQPHTQSYLEPDHSILILLFDSGLEKQ